MNNNDRTVKLLYLNVFRHFNKPRCLWFLFHLAYRAYPVPMWTLAYQVSVFCSKCNLSADVVDTTALVFTDNCKDCVGDQIQVQVVIISVDLPLRLRLERRVLLDVVGHCACIQGAHAFFGTLVASPGSLLIQAANVVIRLCKASKIPLLPRGLLLEPGSADDFDLGRKSSAVV